MKVFLSRIHSSFWNDPNFFLLYRRNLLWWLPIFAYSFHKKCKGVFIFIFYFYFQHKARVDFAGERRALENYYYFVFFLMDFCFVLYFWTFCWLGRWPLDFGQLQNVWARALIRLDGCHQHFKSPINLKKYEKSMFTSKV